MSIKILTFGSHGRSLYVRCVQIILFFLALMMLPEQKDLAASWLFLIPLCVAQIVLYRIVDARVGYDAVEYRHWFKWRQLAWSDIEKIIQNPYTDQVTIKIRGRNIITRFLLLGRPSMLLSDAAKLDVAAKRFYDSAIH